MKHRALGGNAIDLNCSMYIPPYLLFVFSCACLGCASVQYKNIKAINLLINVTWIEQWTKMLVREPV